MKIKINIRNINTKGKKKIKKKITRKSIKYINHNKFLYYDGKIEKIPLVNLKLIEKLPKL